MFNENMQSESPAKEVGPRMIRTTRNQQLQTLCVYYEVTIGTHNAQLKPLRVCNRGQGKARQ